MADPTQELPNQSQSQTSNQVQLEPPTPATEDQQKKEALAAFTATLHSVGTNLEAPLRDRATVITTNASALQRQETELAENTARLARQNAQWAGLADETRDGLKEIGDVQNWAEMIERDLLVLEDMMDCVEGGANEDEEGFGYSSGDEDVNGNGNGVVEREGHGDAVYGAVNGDGHVNGNLKKDEGKKGWLRWWW